MASKENADSKPKDETPKEDKKTKSVDWKARAEELKKENAELKVKPETCPRCMRSDCCGVK